MLEDFQPNLSLEMLQCLVLSCYFDLFLGSDANAQFSAECFTAQLVAFARRTSAMVRQEKRADLDAYQDGMKWMQWVGEEMQTRSAYAIIALDSFLPLLRGQLPSRRYVDRLEYDGTSTLIQLLLDDQIYNLCGAAPPPCVRS